MAILKEVSLVIVGILIVFGISILLKYLTNSPIDWPDTVFKSILTVFFIRLFLLIPKLVYKR
ncbi:hypothetical protein M3E13_04660 [Oceanobacillus kimchii]|uniref:hypothetical protein n=1 Tax=Oceanobacillus kimchii TaxID=746691 RepID=UPI0021A2E6CF|nr:hypothetical protein [Oceanobacillus kimchii]MCT1577134.1 hypothetical protein [Oceanobacillus kimchii]MCT2135204.1 hypothetical protein [Oceanobacillus kimchii]